MNEKGEGYYSIPLNDCLARISDCVGRQKVIKSFIQEYANDDEAWESSLITLLCEYYSASCRYVDIMDEVILTPPFVDELTEEETISVDAQKYALLSSYTKLLIVDEVELKYMHRIHLFIH